MGKKGSLSAIIRYAGFEYKKDKDTYILTCRDTHQTFIAKYWKYHDESCLSIEHDFCFNDKNRKRLLRLIEHLENVMPDLTISLYDTKNDISEK